MRYVEGCKIKSSLNGEVMAGFRRFLPVFFFQSELMGHPCSAAVFINQFETVTGVRVPVVVETHIDDATDRFFRFAQRLLFYYVRFLKVMPKLPITFQYKIIKTGARAAEYENAIEWLVSANLISRIFRAGHIIKPLENYINIDDFKIFLSDTGLLCAQKDIRAEDVFFMEEELTDFKGGLTENYVNIQLACSGFKTYFWRNEKGTNEIDFIVSLDGKLIPIEVKSGMRAKAASLNEYDRLFKPAYSIRISERNFGFENNIKSVPLYAAFCIRKG